MSEDFQTFAYDVITRDIQTWEYVLGLPDSFWEGSGQNPEACRKEAAAEIARMQEKLRELDIPRLSAEKDSLPWNSMNGPMRN
jgi:hypothetical protein